MDSALRQLIKAGNIEKNPEPERVEWARKLINVYKRQMSYTAQINEMADLFFNGPDEINEEAKQEISADTALPVLKAMYARFDKMEIFDTVEILAAIKAVQKETGVKGRALWMPIRIAITHEMHGPELPETIELLGQKTAMSHLKAMIDELDK